MSIFIILPILLKDNFNDNILTVVRIQEKFVRVYEFLGMINFSYYSPKYMLQLC